MRSQPVMVSLAIVCRMDNPTSERFTPFIEHLGAELVRAKDGASELRLVLKPWQLNGLDVAHGGVIMTLLDATMAVAAKSADPEGLGVVTIEMKTTFMRPAKEVLSALGWCEHRSTTMAFCRGEIRDSAGRLLAQSTATFRRLTTKPKRHIGSD